MRPPRNPSQHVQRDVGGYIRNRGFAGNAAAVGLRRQSTCLSVSVAPGNANDSDVTGDGDRVDGINNLRCGHSHGSGTMVDTRALVDHPLMRRRICKFRPIGTWAARGAPGQLKTDPRMHNAPEDGR